ncbi:MAG: diguanylate cyclase [Bacillota bacterium]|nr:diguanylate cyclase [Bacillota bacterium]MDW7685246.1 diguanylate cyclase [Bacillota bacterium]
MLGKVLRFDGARSIKSKLYQPGLLLLILFGILFITLLNIKMKTVAREEAYRLSQVLASQNQAVHTFINQEQKPSFFQTADLTEDEFIPELMSSTYMIRQINSHLDTYIPVDYYYKEVAINARSPQNEAHDYEIEALQQFRAGNVAEIKKVIDWQGEKYFVYMQAGESMEDGCLQCHGDPAEAPAELVDRYGPERSFNRDPGELVSALSIRIPVEAAYAGANRTSIILTLAYIFMLILFFGSYSSIISRTVLAPVSVMDDRVRQMLARFQSGDQDVDLVGDEIQNVNAAFDFLEQKLSDAYKKLEQHAQSLEVQVEQRTRDLTHANAQLILATKNDWLLGVLNRGTFAERAKAEFDRARSKQGEISMLLIDLDRFRDYNGTYGYQAGDETLIKVADIIQQHIRGYDVIGRYDGEELIVCLPGANKEEATRVASRIVDSVYSADIYHRNNQPHGRMTVSVGIASVENAKDTYFDKLIKEADENMHTAKETRNTYHPQ